MITLLPIGIIASRLRFGNTPKAGHRQQTPPLIEHCIKSNQQILVGGRAHLGENLRRRGWSILSLVSQGSICNDLLVNAFGRSVGIDLEV